MKKSMFFYRWVFLFNRYLICLQGVNNNFCYDWKVWNFSIICCYLYLFSGIFFNSSQVKIQFCQVFCKIFCQLEFMKVFISIVFLFFSRNNTYLFEIIYVIYVICQLINFNFFDNLFQECWNGGVFYGIQNRGYLFFVCDIFGKLDCDLMF